MPELPEVETIVRTLEHQLQDAIILHIDVNYPKVIDNINASEFQSRIATQQFRSFSRKGKYLIFGLSDDVMVCHLRMEGKFYIYDNANSFMVRGDQKHIHLVFYLADGRIVCYHDTRTFGRFYVYRIGEPLSCLANLGYEPWDEALTPNVLNEMVKRKQVSLKTFLLDQSQVTGIGNIYANEICFLLKLDPDVLVSSLSLRKCKDLLDGIRIILENAIASGGTTIRSYTSSLGVSGRFQIELMVYQREGQPCTMCGTPIKKRKQQGRGTYYCSKCQRKRKII